MEVGGGRESLGSLCHDLPLNVSETAPGLSEIPRAGPNISQDRACWVRLDIRILGRLYCLIEMMVVWKSRLFTLHALRIQDGLWARDWILACEGR